MSALIFGVLCALLALGAAHDKVKNLETVFEWNDLEYGFPNARDMQFAISRGLYVPGNGVPIDVGVHYGAGGPPRIFTTIPRFTSGIPYSLATVSNKRGKNGPLLQAYPSYQWHSSHGSNCDGLTSVFRVAIDECGRLWVLDSGRIGSVQNCPPQLLVFNLQTDELMHRYKIPMSQLRSGAGLLITPVVDVRDPPPAGQCRQVMVYIADVEGMGIVVYDSVRNTSWRVQNKLMYPDPDFGTFTIAGESFDLMDGLFALALTPKEKRGERYLYFHALASETENAVPLRVLDNATLWTDNVESFPRAFRTIGRRGIQCAAEAIDSNGNVYCGSMDPIAIFSWNINNSYDKKSFKIVANNPNTLQFASGMKVVRNSQGQEELWTSTCRFQKIAAGTRNLNEVNFRILGCNVNDLQSGRPCGVSKDRTGSPNAYQNLSQNLIFT